MNPDAVISSIANRLGVSKADLLDPTSSDAAVRQAHAETHVIQETKSYLASNGINFDAFGQRVRDERTLLVKNFTFGVTAEELKTLFSAHGRISRILLPPTGTIAIIQFESEVEASQALKDLAYRNFKGAILFLEKGPQGLFDGQGDKHDDKNYVSSTRHGQPDVLSEMADQVADLPTSTIFVRNLKFSTSTARLTETFEPLAGFLSARVKTKVDSKRPGEVLSMGFGFVEFSTNGQAQSAIAAMDGYNLDGHELVVKASQRATDTAEERRRNDDMKKVAAKKTKIIIKNLPFEATKKDVRSLFGAYGQLRSVRVPQKFDRTTRGFAFADFVNTKEAENAIEALTNTHLLGRRLVLEFAAGDAADPEDEIVAMEKKTSQQTDMVHLNRITGSARRKFTVEGGEPNP